MERLWKNAGATGRKRSERFKPRNGSTSQISFPPAATGCRQNRMVRRGSIGSRRRFDAWRAIGAHPSICSGLGPSLGYANRRSLEGERRTPPQPVFDLGDCDELQAPAQRSSGPMCLSKKSRLHPNACAASVGVSADHSEGADSSALAIAPPFPADAISVSRARANIRSCACLRRHPVVRHVMGLSIPGNLP
jgi:hypothetical protein